MDMLYTIDVNQESVDFLEIVEANPYTPLEELFIDFVGKERMVVFFARSIISELEIEEREKLIQLLNTAGFDDIL